MKKLFMLFLMTFILIVPGKVSAINPTKIEGQINCEYSYSDTLSETYDSSTIITYVEQDDKASFNIYNINQTQAFLLLELDSDDMSDPDFFGTSILTPDSNGNLDEITGEELSEIYTDLINGQCPTHASRGIVNVRDQNIVGRQGTVIFDALIISNNLANDTYIPTCPSTSEGACYVPLSDSYGKNRVHSILARSDNTNVNKNYFDENASLYVTSFMDSSLLSDPSTEVKCTYEKANNGDSYVQAYILENGGKYYHVLKMYDANTSINSMKQKIIIKDPVEVNQVNSGLQIRPGYSPSFYFDNISIRNDSSNALYTDLIGSGKCPEYAFYVLTDSGKLIDGVTLYSSNENPPSGYSNYFVMESANSNSSLSDVTENSSMLSDFNVTPNKQVLVEVDCEFGFCSSPGVLRGLNLVRILIDIIKIVVPLLIIIFGIIDLSKPILSGDHDTLSKNISKFIKRLLLGLIIFFIPMLVKLGIKIFTDEDAFKKEGSFAPCSVCITGEKDLNGHSLCKYEIDLYDKGVCYDLITVPTDEQESFLGCKYANDSMYGQLLVTKNDQGIYEFKITREGDTRIIKVTEYWDNGPVKADSYTIDFDYLDESPDLLEFDNEFDSKCPSSVTFIPDDRAQGDMRGFKFNFDTEPASDEGLTAGLVCDGYKQEGSGC